MNNGTKINKLLQDIPAGVVLLSSWLSARGYTYELQQRYRKSGWLTSIGKGAMMRTGDNITLIGALYSLQNQAGIMIHPGGRTAMGLQGLAHYLELKPKETLLFAARGVKLSAWLIHKNWDTQPVLINSSLLPPDAGLTDYTEGGLTIKISNPVRAMLECLEMSPERFSLDEAYQLMEGLSFPIPEVIQLLLEQCNSVKVTRLFLFLAKKAGHGWFDHLKTEKLNLGKGKRAIVPDGVFVPEYQITVPKSLL